MAYELHSLDSETINILTYLLKLHTLLTSREGKKKSRQRPLNHADRILLRKGLLEPYLIELYMHALCHATTFKASGGK